MTRQKARRASTLDVEIGFRIRQVRQHKKISQTMLADGCGFSRQQLRKYELGRDRLTVQKLLQIAEFLEVDINDILKPANDRRLPAPVRDYPLQNVDQLAAHLWGKIKCNKKKRVIVELMDILHQHSQTQPLNSRQRE